MTFFREHMVLRQKRIFWIYSESDGLFFVKNYFIFGTKKIDHLKSGLPYFSCTALPFFKTTAALGI